jgi:hypothetical protein
MARAANDVQTGVRLPAKLYEDLQKAAGQRPVSEEIRRRLAESFATAGPVIDDPRFHDIMAAIAQAAGAAVQMAGEQNDPYGYFASAVPYLLAIFQSKDGYTDADWVGMTVASSALSTMGRTELLARLKEVGRRQFDSSGASRPRDSLLYPQDYTENKP